MELNELVERIQRWKEKSSPRQTEELEDEYIGEIGEPTSFSEENESVDAVEEVSADELIEDSAGMIDEEEDQQD